MKLKDHTLSQYLTALASTEPAPGGGSSSALAVSLAASLGEMVSAILLKRGKQSPHFDALRELKRAFRGCRISAEKIVDADARVYRQVVRAYHSNKKGEQKKLVVHKALEKAFHVMAGLCKIASDTEALLIRLEALGNKSIMNDVHVAKAFIQGGFQGAYLTAKINVECVRDHHLKQNLELQLQQILKEKPASNAS